MAHHYRAERDAAYDAVRLERRRYQRLLSKSHKVSVVAGLLVPSTNEVHYTGAIEALDALKKRLGRVANSSS